MGWFKCRHCFEREKELDALKTEVTKLKDEAMARLSVERHREREAAEKKSVTEFVANLQPYATKHTCAKCGRVLISLKFQTHIKSELPVTGEFEGFNTSRWWWSTETVTRRLPVEHLRHECACGHVILTKTKDA